MFHSVRVAVLALVLLCSRVDGTRATSRQRDDSVGSHSLAENTCHSLGYGKNCTDHVGCAACQWRLKIPRWNFCVNTTIASHLPGFLFACCSSGDDPEPGPPEPEPAPHASIKHTTYDAVIDSIYKTSLSLSSSIVSSLSVDDAAENGEQENVRENETECDGLSKEVCVIHTNQCSWCESQAVTSQCYTKDEATRLPAAVFKCTEEDGLNDESGTHVHPF